MFTTVVLNRICFLQPACSIYNCLGVSTTRSGRSSRGEFSVELGLGFPGFLEIDA